MTTANAPDTELVVDLFRRGQLTEQRLRDALEQRPATTGRQDLLYLQASSTSLESSIVGTTLIRDGAIVPVIPGAEDWPYANVLAALRDGWRIIKFPELALLMVEDRTISFGCEFILEKWS
jgi:hypothetical protein